MRVLFVSHTVLMAGANRSLFQLMLELRDNYGVEPIVLMPSIPKYYEKWNLYKACRKHGIECYSYRFHWFKDKRRLIYYVRCLSNLIYYPIIFFKFRKLKVDIVHSNGSVISLGGFLSRQLCVPHVWHLREFGQLDFGLYSLLGAGYERWIYQKADAYIAISDVVKKHYRSLVPEEKMKMIYNGIVPPVKDSGKRSNDDTIEFCMVGVVSSPKNQLEALKALDVIINEWGERQVHLSFIGFEEPLYANSLRSYIEAKNLGQYVSFLGEREDVNALLCNMHVGLMLSGNEAFGRVTVEYMMQGLAVIASNTGANPEIVVDGASGFLYQLGNYRELADRMRKLIEDKETLFNFAKKGKERALKLFTSIKNTKQVYEVYEELLKSK